MKKYAEKARPFYRKIFIHATIVNKPYGWSTPKHKFAAYGIARMNLLHDSHGQSAHFQRVTGLNVFLPRLLAADLFGSPAWCLPVNFALQHGVCEALGARGSRTQCGKQLLLSHILFHIICGNLTRNKYYIKHYMQSKTSVLADIISKNSVFARQVRQGHWSFLEKQSVSCVLKQERRASRTNLLQEYTAFGFAIADKQTGLVVLHHDEEESIYPHLPESIPSSSHLGKVVPHSATIHKILRLCFTNYHRITA